MGKNRVQHKNKLKDKPRKDNIYTQKHVRITLMKQEKHLQSKNSSLPSDNPE